MTRILQPSLRVCLLVLAVLGPAGCKAPASPATPSGASAAAIEKAASPSLPAEPAAAAETAPPPGLPTDTDPVTAANMGEFHIVSVLLGRAVDSENVVLADTSVFARRDHIHASVLSTGVNQGLRMTARWLAPDGATIAETAEALVPTSATATTFSISNPKGWPVGEYQVLIAVNGSILESRKFSVR